MRSRFSPGHGAHVITIRLRGVPPAHEALAHRHDAAERVLPVFAARGALQLIEDIENKETSRGEHPDFSWKPARRYTCTECGAALGQLPRTRAGKTLDPQKIVLDIRDQLLREGPKLLSDAKAESTPPAHWVETKPDELWACTTCAACVEACPVTIEHIDKIVDMRRSLTLMEGAAPPEAQRAMTNIERAGNPWGEPREPRGRLGAGSRGPDLR